MKYPLKSKRFDDIEEIKRNATSCWLLQKTTSWMQKVIASERNYFEGNFGVMMNVVHHHSGITLSNTSKGWILLK